MDELEVSGATTAGEAVDGGSSAPHGPFRIEGRIVTGNYRSYEADGPTFFDAGELRQIAYIEAEVGTAAAREWSDAILRNRLLKS